MKPFNGRRTMKHILHHISFFKNTLKRSPTGKEERMGFGPPNNFYAAPPMETLIVGRRDVGERSDGEYGYLQVNSTTQFYSLLQRRLL